MARNKMGFKSPVTTGSPMRVPVHMPQQSMSDPMGHAPMQPDAPGPGFMPQQAMCKGGAVGYKKGGKVK